MFRSYSFVPRTVGSPRLGGPCSGHDPMCGAPPCAGVVRGLDGPRSPRPALELGQWPWEGGPKGRFRGGVDNAVTIEGARGKSRHGVLADPRGGVLGVRSLRRSGAGLAPRMSLVAGQGGRHWSPEAQGTSSQWGWVTSHR